MALGCPYRPPSGVLIAVLALLFATSLCGQGSPPGLQPQSHTATLAHNALLSTLDAERGLIKLDVVVSDKTGQPATGFESKDFTVLDNGQPAKIMSFGASDRSAPHDSSLELVLVLDTLHVPRMLSSHEREEVQKFLRRNRGKLAEPVSIFKLVDSGLWLVAEPSKDGNALAENISHDTQLRLIRKPIGPRGLFGRGPDEPPGLLSLKAMGDIATAERQKPGRKLLVWIGPYQEENGAIFHRDRVFNMIVWFSTLLREARVTLYNFSEGENDRDPRASRYRGFLNGAKSMREAEFEYLDRKVLAVQSGGRALSAVDDLASQIANCVEEESDFYTVSFNPAPADHPNDYHDLKVRVSTPEFTARSDTGYYDQPYYQDHPSPSAKPVTVEQ